MAAQFTAADLHDGVGTDDVEPLEGTVGNQALFCGGRRPMSSARRGDGMPGRCLAATAVRLGPLEASKPLPLGFRE